MTSQQEAQAALEIRLYKTWAGMKTRCFNPNASSFKYYGGRGITVCDDWANSFERFATDMGPKPSPQHSLERKDNDGPYAPWNCVWASKLEQVKNRRVKTHCLRGHPLSGANLRVNGRGYRSCKTCNAINAHKLHREKKEASL